MAVIQLDGRRNEATSPHYRPLGVLLHWLMAIMVFSQPWWGPALRNTLSRCTLP